MDISQYKDVYVFVEQRDGAVQSVGLELLGKARQLADTLNEKVVAILLGKNIADKAQGLIAAGADRVLVVDDGPSEDIPYRALCRGCEPDNKGAVALDISLGSHRHRTRPRSEGVGSYRHRAYCRLHSARDRRQGRTPYDASRLRR